MISGLHFFISWIYFLNLFFKPILSIPIYTVYIFNYYITYIFTI